MNQTPSPAWHVRAACTEDAAEIVALLNTVYGNWGSLKDWQWKYQAPPANFRSPSAVADLNGQIIGHFGLLPLEAIWDTELVRGAQTVDAAVLPTYRRQGIHSALGRYVLQHAAQADVAFIYAFPGLFSLSTNQHIGYRAVAFVPEMLRVLKPIQTLRIALRLLPGDLLTLYRTTREGAGLRPGTVKRLARLRRSLLLVASWLSDLPLTQNHRRSSLQTQDFHICITDTFDARFNTLWDNVSHSLTLGVRKNMSYLTWRYQRNPAKQYEAVIAESGQKILGYLVMSQEGRQSFISELLALPERADVLKSLLSTAVTRSQNLGSLILTAWMPSTHPYHKLLQQAGFISQRRLQWLAQRWPMLAQQLYQVIIYAQHLSPTRQAHLVDCTKTWALTMGDSDLV